MRIQYHTYEDSNYTFEITVKSDYTPAEIAEICEQASAEWYDGENTYDFTMAEWMQIKLEEAGCIIEDWTDKTDYEA